MLHNRVFLDETQGVHGNLDKALSQSTISLNKEKTKKFKCKIYANQDWVSKSPSLLHGSFLVLQKLGS